VGARDVGIPSRHRPYWKTITGWARADAGGGTSERVLTNLELSATDVATAGDGSLADTLLLEAVGATRYSVQTERGRTSGTRSRRWLLHRMLVLADVTGLMGAFILAERLSGGAVRGGHFGVDAETVLFVLVLPAWVVVAKLNGLYDNDDELTDHTTADDLVGVLHLVTLGLWFFVFAGWATGLAHPRASKLLIFSLLAIVFVPIARAVARTAARRSTLYIQNALIVGAGNVGQLVARKLNNHPEYGIRVVGYVDSDPLDAALDESEIPVLGDIVDLPDLIEPFGVDRVVVAFSRATHDETLQALRLLRSSSCRSTSSLACSR
jgi:FlaA1/EpsC-like NDP-sugar epimerase